MADAIISRADAKAKGLRHYFLGTPCPNGHLATRFVSSRTCTECERSRGNHYRDPEKRRSGARKRVAEYRRRHKERLLLERRLKYRELIQADPDLNRKKRLKNPEASRQSVRKWAASNPGKIKANTHRYRARKLGAMGFHTAEEIAEMLRKQKWKCVGPGCRASLKKSVHIDHIVALVNGGSNDISNLQGLCPGCNLRKRAKDPFVFAQENGQLL